MPLISLEDAARMLGYTAKGFRKIVDRSRAKAAGHRTHGPTIRFFQATKGAPIKFKPEWIEAFIAEHTFDPHPVAQPEKTRVRPTAPIGDNAGLDSALLSLPKRDRSASKPESSR
jgi:hypothetical protein